MPDKRHIFISLLMLSVLLVQSQEIKINGGFIEDSLQLGSTVHYWVTAEYPMEIEVLFADSNYNFSPFEYADKFFVETELRNDNAFDSVVYGFQSFEIDLIQKLQLPVFVVQSNDSIILTTPLDSLFFEELVPLQQVSDTTQLIQNTQYNPVDRLYQLSLNVDYCRDIVGHFLDNFLYFWAKNKKLFYHQETQKRIRSLFKFYQSTPLIY